MYIFYKVIISLIKKNINKKFKFLFSYHCCSYNAMRKVHCTITVSHNAVRNDYTSNKTILTLFALSSTTLLLKTLSLDELRNAILILAGSANDSYAHSIEKKSVCKVFKEHTNSLFTAI